MPTRYTSKDMRRTRKSKYGYKKKKKVSKAKQKTTDRIATVERRLTTVSKAAYSDLSKHIYRNAAVGEVNCLQNQSNYLSVSGMGQAFVDLALTSVKFFNPSVPGTLTNVDLEALTRYQKIHFSKVYHKLTVRNNYVTPAYVKVYQCVPRIDTSDSPTTCYTAGLTDVGAPSAVSPNVYITDSPNFNVQWKIRKSVRKVLQAGQEITMSYSEKPFDYDPSDTDAEPHTFGRRHRSCVYAILVCGRPAHDSVVTTQHGLCDAGVDYEIVRHLEVSYNSGGVPITNIEIVDGYDSFSNSSQVSNKPSVGQQQYVL